LDQPSRIEVAPHPLLRCAAFVTRFPTRLGDIPSPAGIVDLLRLDAATPLERDEALRAAIRDMLRYGGYKPTGRGKPASEYLVRAAEDAGLSSINLAVDLGNATSLHSGFPISVVDLDRASPPFRIAVADEDEKYVFNAAGQEIDLGGLVCLFDADGPCANAVKDSQRTKTSPDTTRTLTVVWGAAGHEARLGAAVAWYREMLSAAGAETLAAPIQ